MPDAKIDFNDVALIRAFTAIGRECEAKVNRLVNSLKPLLERAKIGSGEISPHSKAALWATLSVGDLPKHRAWFRGRPPSCLDVVAIGCRPDGLGDFWR